MATLAKQPTRSVFLSQAHLNLRNRMVQRELGNSQALHRRLLDAFPGQASRADAGLLYRIEPGRGAAAILLAQSTARPDWERIGAGYLLTGDDGRGPAARTREVGDRFQTIVTGQVLRFRLRANPTSKRHFPPESSARPTGPNGTRVPLFGDEDLLAWIDRKGGQHGFQLRGVRWRPDPIAGEHQRGTKADGTRLAHHAVVFDGTLQVIDEVAFRRALIDGIGPAKAYGFGLLSVAPPTD